MMALDQLHEQNNWAIKSLMASDFANRAALIRWEICGAEISQIINEFEETFRPEIENSSNHHEDSPIFAGKFYRDIKTLYEALPVNLFMLKNEMICKINYPSTDLPKDTYVTISGIIEEGEKQFKSFINERLLYQKVSLCPGIRKNNFDSWHPRQTQLEKYRSLSSSVIKKIYSAIEHRQDLSRTISEFEFQDVSYSLSSDPISVYHGVKSDITIRLPNAPASQHLHTKCKSVIILEMSPIIRAMILRLASSYDRIDVVFDRYFDRSLKEVTRISRGTGTRFKITELPKIPKNFESFLHISQNKNDSNE